VHLNQLLREVEAGSLVTLGLRRLELDEPLEEAGDALG